MDNQRKFWNWFANEHGITKLEDWYSVKLEQVYPYAKGLMDLYKKSFVGALQAAFPEHQFMGMFHTIAPDVSGWKFSSPPKRYWSDGTNRNRCISYLVEHLHIQNLDDWY